MRGRARLLLAAVVLAAGAWHFLVELAPAWETLSARPHFGRDFASYFYAVHAAADGEDPYSRAALAAEAAEQGQRRGVHPFLYPPPFLLLMTWALPLDLPAAYSLWFWLDELWALLAFAALWLWWRPLGPAVGVTLAVLVAANTSIANNHLMGQANFPGLALTLLALWQDDRARNTRDRVVAGALMGAACMLKMSPALFVLWWLLRRNVVGALAAVGTAVALSVAALALTGPEVQLGFYTRVLPSFGSGDYNGLTVPIGMFGNHSIPNVWHQLLPGDSPRVLSPAAQRLSLLSTLALLGVQAWLFRRPARDLLQRGAQASAIAITLLIVPVYAYEHHCVWAFPAAVLCVVALLQGRLGKAWLVPVGLALVAWCFELAELKRLWTQLKPGSPWLALGVQELKFAALLVFLAATTLLGSRGPSAQSDGRASE